MRGTRCIRPSLLALALVVLTNCGTDQDPAVLSGPSSQAQLSTQLPQLSGLLSCTPQPYAVSSAAIGPNGGTLRVAGHVLLVPPGALQESVVITAEAPSDTVASVRFQPEGLRFAAGHPAVLSLDYSNCPLGRLQLRKHIAYTTEGLSVLDLLASVDNLLFMRVSAPVEHFSRYAVAW